MEIITNGDGDIVYPKLEECTIEELKVIAGHYRLDFKSSITKKELIKLIQEVEV